MKLVRKVTTVTAVAGGIGRAGVLALAGVKPLEESTEAECDHLTAVNPKSMLFGCKYDDSAGITGITHVVGWRAARRRRI